MFYDPKEIQHIGDDISLLAYQPVSSYGKNEKNKLILSFKDNHTTAVQYVTDIVLQLFTKNEKMYQHELGFRYVVSIPSSTAGRTNAPCERICSVLAQRFSWLTHIPHALERVQSVLQSHRVRYEERLKCFQHMQTIQYTGPALHIPNESFVMLDDIITFGETSKACRRILKRETECKRVIGLFVGRTVGH